MTAPTPHSTLTLRTVLISNYDTSSQRRLIVVAGLYFLAISLIAARLFSLSTGRTFFFDEWSFVVGRSDWSWETLLTGHNGHPSVFPSIIYLTLLQLFGLANFSVFLLAGIVMHLTVCALAAVLIQRRLGALAGLAGFIAFGLLGTGWQNSLWPFQVGFMGSMVGFLAALLLLDSHAGSKAAAAGTLKSAGASMCLVYSVMSTGVGLAAVAGISLWILLNWSSFRGRRWVPVPAVVTYGVWYLTYGGGQIASFTPLSVPRYVAESAAFATSGLFGLDLFWGSLFTGFALAALVTELVRKKLSAAANWVPSFGFLLAFWILTAISRGAFGEAGASRYVYMGVIIGVVGACYAFPASTTSKSLFVALSIVSIVATSSTLAAGAGGLRYEGELMRTLLAWVDFHGERMPADLIIDERHSPQLTVAGYRHATLTFKGTPASGIDLSEVSPPYAERLDLLVSRSWVIETPPTSHECKIASATGRVELAPGTEITLTTGVDTYLEFRRFAPDTPSAILIPITAGSIQVKVPSDPWPQNYVVIVGTPDSVSICGSSL